MRASEFIAEFGKRGLNSWEGAAVELARQGQFVEWPWVDVPLSDGSNTAIVRMATDAFAVGTPDDYLRLPLTPTKAQDIFNLFGWLLPTPWLVYQRWRAAPIKLTPTPMVPNLGANLAQYAAHSAAITEQVAGRAGLVAGAKKSVVVSNIYQPGKVLIFGWYKPEPDVFDDKKPYTDPKRQPRQAKSNVHGDFYVDYSHGIYAMAPVALVNGREMNMVDLYQHPTLSKLVSNEGPVKMPRYPSKVPPAANRPAHVAEYPTKDYVVGSFPGLADVGLDRMLAGARKA